MEGRQLLAYVHIFKAAGTTLTGILRRNFSYRHLDTRLIQERPALKAAQLKRAMLLYPRLLSIAGHAVRPHSDLRSNFPGIRFYTFLREPKARLVSAFLFLQCYRIRDGRWRPQGAAEIEARLRRWIVKGRGYCPELAPGGLAAAIEAIEAQIGFVGLVERFDESLAMLTAWIARPDFDPRYRRLNTVAQRSEENPSLKDAFARLDETTRALVERPDIATMIEEACRDDIALYRHVRGNIFERQRQLYRVGPGPFAFETAGIATDTLLGHAHRAFIGRPLAPLLARVPKSEW